METMNDTNEMLLFLVVIVLVMLPIGIALIVNQYYSLMSSMDATMYYHNQAEEHYDEHVYDFRFPRVGYYRYE